MNIIDVMVYICAFISVGTFGWVIRITMVEV